ncbi:MAG: SpoIIIAH-like family protein [Deltaproteobacteria bacterium]
MTVIKRNQIIALAVAIMIITAGYLNYTYKGKDPFAQELTGNIGDKFTSERLGEATLVEETGDAEIGQASPVSSSSMVPKVNDTSAPKQDNNIVKDKSILNKEDFFDEARLERERVRDAETEIFEKIISSETAAAESQSKAQVELTALSQKWEKEMIIERLIKAKGFKDAIVFINEKSVNVVVLNGNPLVQTDVAQIQDIVTREAKVAAENIKIIGK